MNAPPLTPPRVLVLGLGVSGLEAARLLHAEGAQVTVRDEALDRPAVHERATALRTLGVEVELGPVPADPGPFDYAVLSPGVPPTSPLVATWKKTGRPLVGELELGFRSCRCPIVAITGTNGKTTTTELIAAVLQAGGKKAAAAGNIGTPFTQVARRSSELDYVVLEVSSFQLEQVEQFRPHIAVHLNLTPDHLDRYPNLKAYEESKWALFRNQQADDFAVLNPALRLPPLRARPITFSAQGLPADYEAHGGGLLARGERVLEQNETRLVGPHNAENMLAALAVADLCGIARADTVAALRAYRPLPHRCENVGTIDGVDYLNDSKATNLDALEKALQAIERPIVLIAGGKDKGLNFQGLNGLVQRKVKGAVLIGQMALKLRGFWQDLVPCQLATSLADAVERAQRLAQPGDAVLLSPGCSSYDMFSSFEDRGDQFRSLVQARLAPLLSKNQPPNPTER